MEVSFCFPKSDFSSGMFEFPILRESLGKFELTIFTIGSVALYPVIGAITIIAEIYLSLNSLYHSLKVKKHKKPIPTHSTPLVILRDKRIAKLESRENDIPRQVKEMIFSLKKELLENYERIKETDFDAAITKGKLQRRLTPLILYNKIIGEKESYTTDISETLSKRHAFAKLRHQIAIKVNMHYMKNLSKILIPVIGLYWLLKSKETTREFFEKNSNKTLIIEYNKMMQETSWLKPY